MTKRDEINQIPSSVALRNLIIDDFDDEQIWQELELQNRAYKNDCVNFISKVIASSQRTGKRLTFASCGKKNDDVDDDVSILDHSEIESQTHSEVEDNVESENDDAEDSKVIALGGRLSFEDADDSMSDISIELEKALDKRIALDKDNSSSSSDDDERNDYDDKGGSRLKEKDDSDKDTEAIDQSETNKTHIDAPKQKKNKLKRSIVDDTFFKLSELELFLDSEDAKEERRLRSTLSRFPENSKEWDDDINYFEDIQSGNEDEYDSGDSKAEHKVSCDSFCW